MRYPTRLQKLAIWGFGALYAWLVLGSIFLEAETFQASGIIVFVGFIVGAAILGLVESLRKHR